MTRTMINQTTLNENIGELTDAEIKNAPGNLYFQGNLHLLSQGKRVSVVGSRKATSAGMKRARILTEFLVKNDIVVVSGLAEGIDTIAHQAAIVNGGKTIAVLGTPLNKIYPKSNTALLEIIKKNHLALSQFSENDSFQKKNFPIRNRTMALISDATIIIEATENSGTRHQGWEALRLGRVVYLLENILNNKSVTWAREMLNYGAQVLTRSNVEELILDIPNLTGRKEVAF